MTSHHASSFRKLSGVSAEIAAVLAKNGITTPTDIQREVIPVASGGRDILAQAPTGSGKTFAFGIPLVERMPDRVNAPLALVLVPTRELALQVAAELQLVGDTRRMKVAAVFGGANIMTQTSQAKRAAIIVATPGRFDDMMRKSLIKVSRIRTIVLDEADRMLDMGFQPQVDNILDRLPRDRHTMLFSATLAGAMRSTLNGYVDDPFVAEVAGPEPTDMGGIDHRFLPTVQSERTNTLIELLNTQERDLAAVFVRTKRGADKLDKDLRKNGVKSTAIHGGMAQNARIKQLKRFTNGEVDVIIATDVFARGIDVDRITHVINYDPPEDADTYKHRAGRTGRAGREGIAVSLVTPQARVFYKGVSQTIGLDGSDAVKKPGRRAAKREATQNVPNPAKYPSRQPRVAEKPAPETKPVWQVDRPEPGQASASKSWRDRTPFAKSGVERTSRSDARAAAKHGKPAKRTDGPAASHGVGTQGIVKWFADRKGFGFIERADGPDLFVHQSSIRMNGRRTLREGQVVSFSTGPGKRGEEAREVKVLNAPS